MALLNSGRVMANQGKHAEALGFIEQAIVADPTYDRPLLAKAFTLSKLGRSVEALAIVDEYIRRDSGNAVAYATRGTVLTEAGQMDEADAAFAQAVRLAPTEYLTHYNYACFCARAGREETCRRELTRALELNPGQKSRAATDLDFEPFYEQDWFRALVAFTR